MTVWLPTKELEAWTKRSVPSVWRGSSVAVISGDFVLSVWQATDSDAFVARQQFYPRRKHWMPAAAASHTHPTDVICQILNTGTGSCVIPHDGAISRSGHPLGKNLLELALWLEELFAN